MYICRVYTKRFRLDKRIAMRRPQWRLIINMSFRPPQPRAYPAAAARDVVCGASRPQDIRQHGGATFRGCGWKRPRLPVLTRTIGKEMPPGFIPPAYLFRSRSVLAKSQRPGAKSCSSPTNSDAPSPTCGSPSPTAVTTSVFTAAPATKAHSMAICRFRITFAWPAYLREWGSRKFA
jgi:hypothetical protein